MNNDKRGGHVMQLLLNIIIIAMQTRMRKSVGVWEGDALLKKGGGPRLSILIICVSLTTVNIHHYDAVQQ
jgi:hypothetical protein